MISEATFEKNPKSRPMHVVLVEEISATLVSRQSVAIETGSPDDL